MEIFRIIASWSLTKPPKCLRSSQFDDPPPLYSVVLAIPLKMSLRLRTEDYTVAWFAPLHFEASAAILMLDEHHQSPLPREGQRLCYRFGRMGLTNVAIAFFPVGEIGIAVASYMAAETQRDLPNIKTGLLVGIGAGIPRCGHDMRLGDVVIATPTENNSGVYDCF